MTKIEKVIAGLILVCLLWIAGSIGWLGTRPDGYFREGIIETGKEVKQIYKEINE